MKPNGEPRDRRTEIQLTDIWQRFKGSAMKKDKSFQKMVLDDWMPMCKKMTLDTDLHSLIKIEHKPIYKVQNYKTSRRKYERKSR